MKITYVTMQFPVPSETFASLDVATLCELGHSVSVKALRFQHPAHDELVKERGHTNLKISHLSFYSFLSCVGFIFTNFNILCKLIFWILQYSWSSPRHLLKSFALIPSVISVFKEIRDERPDIVHLFWGHYPSMVGLLIKQYLPNIKVSMFLGAHDLVAAYPLSCFLSKRADLVFTHSEANIPFIQALGVNTKNLSVVHRGTNIKNIPSLPLEEINSSGKIKFLTAARLIKEKGIDDVLRILHGVSELNYDITLDIAGEGPYKKELERQVCSLGLEGKVMFLGHVPQKKLLMKMANANFFLLMSRYESERLPNVVKEAMYQRCIVVTTDTQGINELVNHGKDGFVVLKGDIDTALSFVATCLNDSQRCRTIVDEARSKITNSFDVRVSMNKYVELWASVLVGENS